MWENYYRDAFSPGGKDYYIAGLWGGGLLWGKDCSTTPVVLGPESYKI